MHARGGLTLPQQRGMIGAVVARLRWLAAWMCLCAACLHATPRSAWAAPSSSDLKVAQAKAVEAKAYYGRSLYKEAADTFMEAYALSQAPDMMYNAARAYEMGKLLERARALYETYLGLAGVSDDGKKEAKARIAAITAQLDAKPEPARSEPANTEPTRPDPGKPSPTTPEPAKSEPAKSEPAKSAPAAAEPVAVDPARAATAVQATAQSSNAHWWWAGGAGLALLLSLGMYNNGVAKAEAANRMDFGQADAASKYNAAFDEAQTDRGGAVFMLAVGLGLGGWAAHKWLSRPGRATKTASWWMAPTWSADAGASSGGLAVGGSW